MTGIPSVSVGLVDGASRTARQYAPGVLREPILQPDVHPKTRLLPEHQSRRVIHQRLFADQTQDEQRRIQVSGVRISFIY